MSVVGIPSKMSPDWTKRQTSHANNHLTLIGTLAPPIELVKTPKTVKPRDT